MYFLNIYVNMYVALICFCCCFLFFKKFRLTIFIDFEKMTCMRGKIFYDLSLIFNMYDNVLLKSK